MMEIHIEQIKEGGLELEFEEIAETFPVLTEMVNNGECKFQTPIKTALRAMRIEDMVEVDGYIETSVRLPCSRCLQLFETHLKSNFTLTFTRRTTDDMDEHEPQEVELSVEDMGLVYFQGEIINLKKTIQEQVVMEFPLKALCRQDCKGLCPKCGADLNVTACDCARTSTPGKFAVLKNLKLEK
jgi:uncharacterized protein